MARHKRCPMSAKRVLQILRSLLHARQLRMLRIVLRDHFLVYNSSNASLPDSFSWICAGRLLEIACLTVFLLGVPNLVQGQTQGRLQGTVTDASTGAPLMGATVRVEGDDIGTTTDDRGVYELRLPEGTYTIVFDFVGYRQTTRTVDLSPNATADVSLEERQVSMSEVVVEGQTERDPLRTTTTGIARLEAARLERLPTFMGSPDIVRGLLAKPGVSSVSEGAAGFNVRGGNVGQNLVLFDGTPVYYSSHLFGLFDSFNADVVSDVTLHKSSIPARYGGRLSSVLRVEQKAGDRESIHLRGGVSPITSRLFVEGPIVQGKTSFVAGGRVSYVNWLLNASENSDLENSRASFHDVNLGVNHQFGPSDELDVTGYRASDDFALADTTFAYATNNASLKWRHLFSDRLFVETQALMGRYDLTIRDEEPADAFILESEIRTSGLRSDFTWDLRSMHTLKFGGTAKYFDIEPGTIQPDGSASTISPLKVQAEYGLESALYLSDEMTLTDQFAIEAGIRFSAYNQFGPSETLVFEDDSPRNARSVTDTVTTERGERAETYFGFEPRLSLRYSLSETRSLKASYDRTRQYLHLLSNSTAVAPTDVWQLSTRHRKPQTGDQIAVGYFQNFDGEAITSSVEVFYKWIQDAPVFKPGTEPLLNTSLSTDLLSGNGRAYGIEAEAEKTSGKYTGRISYTYSRTLRQVTGSTPGTRINRGDWYPASHDRPHELTARFTYTGDDPRAQWNFKFVYRSGRAITFPSSKFVVNGIPLANVTSRNQARVPDYHRLDLSLRLDLERRKKRGWNGSWTFSLFNAYGRRNVSAVFFGRDESGQPQAFSRSVLGTVFPSLTYTFEY